MHFLRTPDGHLTQRVDAHQRLEVAARLDARSDDRQRCGGLAREELRRYRRHRRGSRLGDVAPIEQRDERACSRVHQDDRREVRIEPARVVSAEDRHDLRAKRFPGEIRRLVRANEGGHEARKRIVGDRDDGAHRLRHMTGREAPERGRHRLDEIVHRQDGSHVGLRQQAEAN